MRRAGGLVALAAAALLLPGCGSTPKRDLDLDRIGAQWEVVASAETRALAPLPAADVDRLLGDWRRGPVRERDREFLGRLAEARIALFNASVAAERGRQQLEALADERNAILLKASQREAELARLEAEKLRLQNLIRAEETERLLLQQAQEEALLREETERQVELAREEAQSARRLADAQAREAELARREAELLSAETVDLRAQLAGLRPVNGARGRMLVLGDVFFASGQGELKDEARAAIQPVQDFIDRYPGLPVAIEGHTDDRGGTEANQRLSERRAASVRDALLAIGVDASRIRVRGLGESAPVADNGTSSGRGRNRRVEVIVEGSR